MSDAELPFYMRRRHNQRVHVFPQPRWVYKVGWTQFMERRSGDAVCPDCGAFYFEHPTHPTFAVQIPTLVVACDGTPVKT